MVDILIRDIDPETHRNLRIQAAAEGITLSEAAKRTIRANTSKPVQPFTLERFRELQAKWKVTAPVDPISDAEWARAIREGRDELDARDDERAREWLAKDR